MKLLLALLLAFTCAPSLDAQQLSEIRSMKRVRLFVADSVHTGDWVGVRDSVAGVSRGGTLVSYRVAALDSVQVFKSYASSVALGAGLLAGTVFGTWIGLGLGSDCGSPNCTASYLRYGGTAFVLIGGAAAVLGAMLSSGTGRWQSYYRR